MYYVPPGVVLGQPGVTRRKDFFDSKRQMLKHLHDSGNLTAERRSCVERALHIEDQKFQSMPNNMRRVSASKQTAMTDTNEKGGGDVAGVLAKASARQPARSLSKPSRAPRAPRLPSEGCGLAEWRAKEVLGHVARSGRKIQDKDVLRVLDAWKFRPNTKRRNVMREGVVSVSSEMLGLIRLRVYNKFVVANRSMKFPNMTLMLSKYFRDHPPAGQAPGTVFPFTTICVNKNYAAGRHRDVNNVGLSTIRALGEFSGGKLRYWPKDTRKGDVADLDEADSVQLNVHGRTVCMRSTLAHEVEPFKGTRYSLVYFSITSYERASDEVRPHLSKNCGIDLLPLEEAYRMWPKPVV